MTPALASLEGSRCRRRDPGKPLLVALQAVLEWMRRDFELADTVAPTATLADAIARRSRRRAGSRASADLRRARLGRAGALRPRLSRSGYLEDDAEQALYAWAEMLVPGAGWRGLDPCTGLVTNDTYVTVATGRDALDCPPVRSACKGGAEPAKASAVEVRGEQ